ncbi:MAG: PqqD family protein [Ignavibacteriae bacterium]|nr:MAG: PqqD family protein [Ignavibacteriota bacterium]
MDNFQNYLPVRNCEYEINNELVTVLFQKEQKGFIEKKLFPKLKPKTNKIDLDEIGSFIWLRIDGENNISEITKIAEEHFQDKISPAKERVELFFQQMFRNKLISLYEKKK